MRRSEISLGEPVFFELCTGTYQSSLHRDIDSVLIETHFEDIPRHVGTRDLAFILREEVRDETR